MKLLVVLSRFPYPLEKGDKLRAYHQIKILSKFFDIYLFALSEKTVPQSSIDALQPFCKQIHIEEINLASKIFNTIFFFFRGLPLQCGFFYRRKAKNALTLFYNKVQPDKIYCQLVRTAEYVKSFSIDKTIDYQDVLSKGMLRRHSSAPIPLKPFFKMEYRRLLRYEQQSFNWFDHHTIITNVDRTHMPMSAKEQICVVGNGVDFQNFIYKNTEKKYDLIFSGNMGYAPNIDAAEYLVKKLLPPLLQRYPNLRLILCGTSPSIRIKALQNEHVVVTGWVDDMSEWYAQSRVFIAPMRLGTGLQNKLLEAMAMQLPCVTSPLAAMPIKNAVDQHDIIVCHKDTDYIENVSRLLDDDDFYRLISQNGHQFVLENFSWEQATQTLVDLLND